MRAIKDVPSRCSLPWRCYEPRHNLRQPPSDKDRIVDTKSQFHNTHNNHQHRHLRRHAHESIFTLYSLSNVLSPFARVITGINSSHKSRKDRQTSWIPLPIPRRENSIEAMSSRDPGSPVMSSASIVSSWSEGKKSQHSQWRHTMGIILLLATVVLWTASNFLSSVSLLNTLFMAAPIF